MGVGDKYPIFPSNLIKHNEHGMKNICTTCLLAIIFLSLSTPIEARKWSLKDCIHYALSNNISLKKTSLKHLSAIEDTKQSQAALLPSLNAATSQNATYRPWPQTGIAAEGYVQTSIDKVYYNGTYSVNGSWTVWNGGRNTNTVKLNRLTEKQAALDSATMANQLIEQIAQLYVQILYSSEAIAVNKSMLASSVQNEKRGEEFMKVQKMSRADMAQLTAQRAQDEYNVVEAESNLRNYKRQLKQLLQLVDEETFEIDVPHTTDAMALQPIPTVKAVYSAALNYRPEIQNAQLGIESSNLSVKIAKASRLPVIGINAGVGTSTTSMSDYQWGNQMKNNFDIGAGISLSIPLFDNRQAKTAVNKAMLQKQNYMLDLKDKQTTLYSNIEDYWLQAVNNQNRFKAAKVSTQSAEESFRLLKAKFDEQLINIVELTDGKNKLMTAEQNELQAKYLAILNIGLLKFYQTGLME